MPGLQSPPVVGEQVHRTVGADRVEHRGEVPGELVEPVGRPPARSPGLTGSPDVVAHHVIARRQLGGHAVPQAVVVGVAMHADHRGRAALARLVHP